jgi:hypothetical protein
MSKQVFLLRAVIKSFTRPDKQYPIKRDEQGQLSCGCPDWIYRKSKNKTPEDRMCKHLQKISASKDKLEKLFLMGDKFVLEIDHEKWEVSKELTPTGEVNNVQV